MSNPFPPFHRLARHVLRLLVALLLTWLPGEATAQPSVTEVTSAQSEPMPVAARVSSDTGTDMPDIDWPNARIEVKASSTATPTPTPGVKEITLTLPGDVPLVMVLIPAGSFVMGSPPDERSRESSEGPQTNVTLTRDFYMGKYPVTQGQWEAVMGEGNWPFTAPSGNSGSGPDHPMYNVDWSNTQEFVEALNAYLTATSQGPATMRLPTEAEWEYACRAGTTTRFYFGDSLIDVGGNSDGDWCEDDGLRSQHMWYCYNSGYRTHPVGQKLPNALGLHDMVGTLWEWCQDWYPSSLPGGSVVDPTGLSIALYRSARGGAWFNHAAGCRSAARYYAPSSSWGNHLGFRIASVAPTATLTPTPSPTPGPTATPGPTPIPTPTFIPTPLPTPYPGDSDGNGISDEFEIAHGSDPFNPASFPPILDFNNDGILDEHDALLFFKQLGGLVPLDPGRDYDALDFDGDGRVTLLDALLFYRNRIGHVPVIPLQP